MAAFSSIPFRDASVTVREIVASAMTSMFRFWPRHLPLPAAIRPYLLTPLSFELLLVILTTARPRMHTWIITWSGEVLFCDDVAVGRPHAGFRGCENMSAHINLMASLRSYKIDTLRLG